jgi:hypothetical protein
METKEAAGAAPAASFSRSIPAAPPIGYFARRAVHFA